MSRKKKNNHDYKNNKKRPDARTEVDFDQRRRPTITACEEQISLRKRFALKTEYEDMLLSLKLTREKVIDHEEKITVLKNKINMEHTDIFGFIYKNNLGFLVWENRSAEDVFFTRKCRDTHSDTHVHAHMIGVKGGKKLFGAR